MNETTAQISSIERGTLLAFTLVPLLFFLSFFAEAAIRDYNAAVSDPTMVTFATDDPVPRMPAGVHLLTVPIFLSLIRPRRFFAPTTLAVIYASLVLLSFYLRVDGESFLGGPIPGDPDFFQELYLKTWIWDYVALGFLVVLLPWLLSIVYRLHRGDSRKPGLA